MPMMDDAAHSYHRAKFPTMLLTGATFRERYLGSSPKKQRSGDSESSMLYGPPVSGTYIVV
jgi:hypothetical protein